MDNMFKDLSDKFTVIKGRMSNIYHLLNDRYPKTHKMSMMFWRLRRYLDIHLSSRLDDVICSAYPPDIHDIPNTDTRLTRAFYKTMDGPSPFESERHARNNKPKNLYPNMLEYVVDTLDLIEEYVTHGLTNADLTHAHNELRKMYELSHTFRANFPQYC